MIHDLWGKFVNQKVLIGWPPSVQRCFSTGSSPAKDVSSTLLFLRKDEIHETEKPYKLQYNTEDAIPQQNTVQESRGPISIRDLRGQSRSFSFEANGFSVLEIESKMDADDFADETKVKNVYYPEVQSLLLRYFGAKRVEILEHLIRKRHPEFPISTGGDYDYLQPASIVHVDFTMASVLEASQDILKVNNAEYDRIQCINIWKPLRGPLTDWPLAFCDAESVNVETDLIAADVVSRTGYTENFLVYYNPKHQWYYLSEQKPTELSIFCQGDTKFVDEKSVPHCGFRNPLSDPNERPRESIETRAFVYY